MKFIKLLWFDAKNGLFKNKVLLLSALILSGAFFLDFDNNVRMANRSGFSISPSYADFFLYVYGGMKEYIPSPTNLFRFPIVWILWFVFLLFSTLNYPYNDLQSFGQQILVRTKGRSLWWTSKCGWNVLSSCVFHGIIALAGLLLCPLTGVRLSGVVNMQLLQVNFQINSEQLVSKAVSIPFFVFLLPLLLSTGLSLLQMTLSLFLKPLFSFLAMAVLLVSSAYLLSPFVVGNYAMLVRSDRVISNGVSPTVGLAVSIVLIAGSFLVGIVRFRYYDILNRE